MKSTPQPQDRKETLSAFLAKHEAEILAEWVQEQTESLARRDQATLAELRTMSRDVFAGIVEAAARGSADVRSEAWSRVRDLLSDFSSTRAHHGYSPTETATFVFSLKKPVFSRLRIEYGNDAGLLGDLLWTATQLIDALGLFTTEAFQRSREEVIARQQRELLELSTPVVGLWDDILALPLIGTLDSNRTQVVMESLLEKIVETGASIAIIDITGVPTVDTLVAQHLMKTVSAARLMGADCIISGIRPQIAQTIVHLGVNLSEVTTKASLADAFAIALKRTGARIVKD